MEPSADSDCAKVATILQNPRRNKGREAGRMRFVGRTTDQASTNTSLNSGAKLVRTKKNTRASKPAVSALTRRFKGCSAPERGAHLD